MLNQFTAQHSARHGVRPPRFSWQAKALLLRYDWPGNVRELRNVVETLCLLVERPRGAPLEEELAALSTAVAFGALVLLRTLSGRVV